MGSSFGEIFKITTFGESHGSGIGVIIDGCPPDVNIDLDFIQSEMSRRRPGQSRITTARRESDEFVIQSGVFEGKSTGTPISIFIPNQDQRSKDYSHIKDKYRPSHADFTYDAKYGNRDYRGGGRSSARETAARVAAGAIAKTMLRSLGVEVNAYVQQVGTVECNIPYQEMDLLKAEENDVRCPDSETADRMIELIRKVKKDGDSIGGVVQCIIKGSPVGLGEPVFDKLHADLGKAMLSINAVKGFEYGSGFKGSAMLGSEHNDEYFTDGAKVRTRTNWSGGIQGGISNGEDIYFRVAFKPVATIIKDQQSIDNEQNEVTVQGKGRHDPCVVPRAVPIVEAMAALVIADHFLMNKTIKV